MSKCAGLPIAITTVGRALKHKSKNVWNDALRQLTRACPENIPGMIQEVYPKIELSYECLESHEAKACFLLCCLYPEGCNIPIEDLVRYGCGLKLFKSIHSMVEGRNSVETLVGILKTSSLLVDSNNEGCVRMHDEVRDAALSIASKSRDVLVVRYGTELTGWPNNYVSGQYISSTLITNETPELLLLSCPDECLLKPLATILEGMENLKVLVMKNTFVLPILPSLPLLKNLQTLCLEHCNLNLDIGPVIGELRTLMTLSLRGSYMEQLPDECKNLIDLRVLDLTGCNSLKVISPGVISKFFLLEELYMWNNFGQWVVGDQTPIVLDQPCMDRVEAQLEQEQIDTLEEEFLGSRLTRRAHDVC
ncbi:hypothetical protein PRUPE_8G185800 [Prunus persica]|uniref:NB-ARC domain-containing protein n=1 Tax=Prunus persica TaxID=3760 RepID=A0A251MZX9_PRUPE|nr:disease resistance protein At4g27190 [Prunus persica]ONH92637.1 hypothetical protein PRUPE_8G185800 [Prunus persica]